ncbi:hypothetical protein KY284_025475 [Solanum tuberosum]|nr:hypothetical protein KY284_025475 [Solanum tuberosum]
MVGSVNIDHQGKGGYVSDEVLGTFLPIVVYWVYSGLYLMFGNMDNYRLHSKKDEDEKNLVSKKEVVKGVLLQQIVQAAVATVLFARLLCIMMNMDSYSLQLRKVGCQSGSIGIVLILAVDADAGDETTRCLI